MHTIDSVLSTFAGGVIGIMITWFAAGVETAATLAISLLVWLATLQAGF